MIEVGVYDRLVPAGDVFDLLVRENDRRGTFSDFELCSRAALDMLVARMRGGHLHAYSTTCDIDSSIDTGLTSVDCIIATWDFHRHDGLPAKIPREFWMHFHDAGLDRRTFDSLAGDFRFNYMDSEYSHREGNAYSVYFDQKGLPPFSVPNFPSPLQASSRASATGSTIPAPANKGRRPANWWPDFAEELAMFCLESGLPEGTGTTGQSEMLKAIFDGMAKNGKAEPSRTQVQSVINNVLTRFRAGN